MPPTATHAPSLLSRRPSPQSPSHAVRAVRPLRTLVPSLSRALVLPPAPALPSRPSGLCTPSPTPTRLRVVVARCGHVPLPRRHLGVERRSLCSPPHCLDVADMNTCAALTTRDTPLHRPSTAAPTAYAHPHTASASPIRAQPFCAHKARKRAPAPLSRSQFNRAHRRHCTQRALDLMPS
ncbi:hypothetical protein DENSPDRAFT_886951 [Dentipellis sp. KUC8613]|nr:hypothetical protein DENSPDRAFT_886951 [Dentipellis sp. KUC8613]